MKRLAEHLGRSLQMKIIQHDFVVHQDYWANAFQIWCQTASSDDTVTQSSNLASNISKQGREVHLLHLPSYESLASPCNVWIAVSFHSKSWVAR